MISLPLANLEGLLSNCATFQTWTGSANATEALDRIEIIGTDDATTKPFVRLALVDFDYEIGQVGIGVDSGAIEMVFYSAVSSGNLDNYKNEFYEHFNQVGPILSELNTQGLGANGNLIVQRITMEDHGISDAPEIADGDREFISVFRVPYGIEIG